MLDSIDPKRLTRRWSGGLLAVVASAAIGLAACGGSSGRHVASLPTTISDGSVPAAATVSARSAGNASGGSSTTPLKGNPTALLDAWASCMHSHGDPNQADPTVDAYGVINVTIPSDAQALSGEVHAGVDPCNRYMAAAQTALRAANPVAPPPDQTELVKYVECMRANGVPNYPYPTGNETNFNGTGVDPTSPFVMNVNNICGKKLDLPGWWVSGNGPPGDVVVTSGGPNGGPPPGAASSGGTRPAPSGNRAVVPRTGSGVGG
jgi:hypothetical protein